MLSTILISKMMKYPLIFELRKQEQCPLSAIEEFQKVISCQVYGHLEGGELEVLNTIHYRLLL